MGWQQLVVEGGCGNAKSLVERLASWPEEDISEFEEAARDIEARRAGIYQPTQDEPHVLDTAERSGTATDEEVEAALKTFRGG